VIPFLPLTSISSWLTRVALGLWLAWSAFALIHATRDSLRLWQAREINATPNVWRFGAAPVRRIQRCLEGVEGLLQANTVVLFVSPQGPTTADFFRQRWAAYLLPDLNVADSALGGETASYVIAYHTAPTAPVASHLDFSRQLEGCRLYRIVRP
jgi:hypothetical protein